MKRNRKQKCRVSIHRATPCLRFLPWMDRRSAAAAPGVGGPSNGSVVVLQCQQNIANVPGLAHKLTPWLTLVAPLSAHPLLSPTINRGLGENGGHVTLNSFFLFYRFPSSPRLVSSKFHVTMASILRVITIAHFRCVCPLHYWFINISFWFQF